MLKTAGALLNGATVSAPPAEAKGENHEPFRHAGKRGLVALAIAYPTASSAFVEDAVLLWRTLSPATDAGAAGSQ